MKKFLFLVLLLSFTRLVAEEYPVNWATSKLMNPANDVTRGLAYNQLTDHVLVATRKFGTDIFILSAATGDSIGKLNTENIAGGTYPINLVAVADDGTIYACNLSAPQYSPGSTLRIYRYADETAAPEPVFDHALGGSRFGDSFAVIGAGWPKYLYVSGMGGTQMAVIKDDGAATLVLEKMVDLPQPGAARHGISPVEPGGRVWINGADTGTPPPQLINGNGTVIAVVPDSLASAGGTSTVKHLILGKYKLVTVANAWGLSVRSVEYFEDELGTVTFDYFGANSDSIPLLFNGNTFINNINATAVIDYDSRRHSLLTLFGYNSVASLSLDSLLKASTPRDEELTISIDGENDFFPTDHVGTSNERDMYLTWSEGKVFVGITGHTLIDPTETNFLYVAFDRDPAGANGTVTPPESAGGILELPFLADVVYQVEPWNAADFLIGKIYKWNGSRWAATEFDGNMASQGALAFAAEGTGKLAELGAIKNEPGIGEDFSQIGIMAYVAEKSVGGNVLCAFPPQNPVGRVTEFTHYFLADSLGSGMFPTDPEHVKVLSKSTAVGTEKRLNPRVFNLAQNYPNPFNPETTIQYQLAQPGLVRFLVYDVTGRLVRDLVNQQQDQGNFQVKIDAGKLSSGVYFYQLQVDQRTVATRKMLLLK
jgi:hypothetical protein